MNNFNYKGWEVSDALDALFAYDNGATDSGIRDESMKDALHEYFNGFDDKTKNKVLADRTIKHFLGENALAIGYGPADAWHFLNWFMNEITYF